MTVTYTGEVATCTGFGCFWKLLFRWRGSIYKLLWPNLVVYSILYFGLSGTYRFLLNSEQRTFFEKMSLHCQVYGDLIPVSFVLGFYVSLVIKRWWDQYLCLPWPDNLALFVSSLVHGQDERGRMMRRTIMRYVNLSLLLTLRMISPRVKKRFPTLDHVVEAGWMLVGEKKIFEDLEHKTHHAKYWMPLVWAGGIVTRARKENRIKDDFALKTLIDELNIFRAGCGGMLNYDWISIPLVYTQVVTLAVYVFFLSTLMGNQYLDPSKGYAKHQIDLILPVFTFLQFFFYMGWLKVAESLVNPFGEDDDDFELNWLLDRNLQISYVIVDEMHQEHPEMLKDQYWDEVFPVELPYTAAAKQYQTGPPQHSAEEVEVPSHKAEFMPLDSVVEEKIEEESESDSGEDVDIQVEHPSVQRGETHPMKIKRRSRTPSGGTTSASEQSSLSSKGKSSVLNLLSRIFHHKRSSKEEFLPNSRSQHSKQWEAGANQNNVRNGLYRDKITRTRSRCLRLEQLRVVNQLGSSASLRSRRANRSTSRLSSVSHSMAPSRSSFVRESIPYNDFQLEVFTMSDLDIPNSGIGGPEGIDQKTTGPPSVDISRSSIFTNPCKTDVSKETGDTVDADLTSFPEGSNKREMRISHSSVPPNFERKEISPSHLFTNDCFGRRDSLARIIVQNNSPVYHVFAPVNSTAFIPSIKFPPAKEPHQKYPVSDNKVSTEKDHKEINFGSDLCPESLITILPPTEAPRFGLSSKQKEKLVKADMDLQSNPPSTSLNYVGSFPQLQDSTLPSLYACVSSSPVTNATLLKEPSIQNFSFSDTTKGSKAEVQSYPDIREKEPKDKPSTNDVPAGEFSSAKTLDTQPESNLSFSEPSEPPSSLLKTDEHGVPAPNPTTPSAAIPVPAMSQAHATPPVDIELGRRPLMHELEPIIEHRDEGTSSMGSSVHELHSEHCLTSDIKKTEDGDNKTFAGHV